MPPVGSFLAEPGPNVSEKTGTGGWPTGVLELQGTPAVDPPPAAARPLPTDPFAAFAATADAPPPEPTPFGHGLDAAAPSGGPAMHFGPLPVTDLSDLEGTGATALPRKADAAPAPSAEDGLALEESTTPSSPLREPSRRWDEPEATNTVAMGPDGFQEVDLSASSTPPDPGFDAFEAEPTPVAPLPPRPAAPLAGSPPVIAPGPGAVDEPPAAAPAAPAPVAAADPARGSAPSANAARLRAFAMNVLSLAALLVVTAGILFWWRGEGVGSLLRLPGGAGDGEIQVEQVTSGVYGGDAGIPLVFVRGVVHARERAVAGPVVVRVDLLRGGTAIGSTLAVAGAVAGPEDLAAIASREDADRLREKLSHKGAPKVEAGASVPFLAFLPLPPGDVGAIGFRAEAVLPSGR